MQEWLKWYSENETERSENPAQIDGEEKIQKTALSRKPLISKTKK